MITTGNRQNQTAGDNAQQLQADTIIVHNGIDEKRAREIYQEMNLQLKKEYSQEALEIAKVRVSEFENRLLPKMEKVDGALQAFADPSFQLLLVDAQKASAASERPADQDLLAELLVHRFEKGENRVVRAGISRAVKIVDEIADDALLGLTVCFTLLSYTPNTGNISEGLVSLNNLFKKIGYLKLPIGREWLDHLDILDAIRVNPVGTTKPIKAFYPQLLNGYIDNGIKRDSENFQSAKLLLINAALPDSFLVKHHLNGEYVRLDIADRNN